MANDGYTTMSPEEWYIDMSDTWLVLWWCRQLGLTKSQLEQAIRAAGNTIADVKQYLAAQPGMVNKDQVLKAA
jgi:hypothetical protein